MKVLFSLFIAIGLSGCATTADLRKKPPALDMTSKKSAKEVALCIAEKWENTKPFMGLSSPPVNTNIRPDGYSITATDINWMGSSSTVTLADVTETKTESATRYYKQGGGGFGDYDQAVIECQ